jgi:dipeptidyl aminopeptidase/acylaminoacyl peptidase
VPAARAQATPPGTNGLAFITAAAPFQLETIAPDGSHRSGPLVTGLQPAWSPDGSRIAYVASVNGISQLFVMNADGSGATQLTHTPDPDDGGGSGVPKWSPDGTKLAFETNQDTCRTRTTSPAPSCT